MSNFSSKVSNDTPRIKSAPEQSDQYCSNVTSYQLSGQGSSPRITTYPRQMRRHSASAQTNEMVKESMEEQFACRIMTMVQWTETAIEKEIINFCPKRSSMKTWKSWTLLQLKTNSVPKRRNTEPHRTNLLRGQSRNYRQLQTCDISHPQIQRHCSRSLASPQQYAHMIRHRAFAITVVIRKNIQNRGNHAWLPENWYNKLTQARKMQFR